MTYSILNRHYPFTYDQREYDTAVLRLTEAVGPCTFANGHCVHRRDLTAGGQPTYHIGKRDRCCLCHAEHDFPDGGGAQSRGDAVMTLQETVAMRLVQLRGSQKQGAVARACGISQASLSNYENAMRYPSLDVLIRLARYYEVPLSAIVSEKDDVA